MKWILVFLFLLVPLGVFAEEIGRYQVVVIPKVAPLDADKVFILDTKEGHMWTWTQYQKIKDASEGGRYLTYQGKVKPSQKMGDIIEKQPWGP